MTALTATKRASVSALLLFVCGIATAQTDPPERKRVGLALGGGSARGIAHVGVLEWLEENRIPVDYIAGTSMGGLIGGSYASGMTAADIRELLHNADWDLIFSGGAPYSLKEFRRKQDSRQYQVKLELGLRHGFSLPSSLDSGHFVGLMLSRIALPYSTLPSFDALPIPFRCMATDLEEGELVTLDHGSLGLAMRATMAIPGVFAPVDWQGRLLVDGGLLNNVPGDIVRAMGADVVIAVDVGEALKNRDQLRSALDQASQSLTVMIQHGATHGLNDADIIIRPDLQSVGSTDWRKSDAIADRGAAAAAEHASELMTLALSEEDWQAHLEEIRARERSRNLTPEFVEVVGAGPEDREAISRRLQDFIGTPLATDDLDFALTALTGTNRYESLSYETTQQDEEKGLLVRIKEKDHGPPFLNFSLGLSNQAEEILFDFGARFTAYDVGRYGAEVRIDGALGTTLGLAAEYYRPLGNTRVFVAPRGMLFRTSDNFFQEEELVATYTTVRTSAGADIGLALGLDNEIRLGYDIGEVNFNRRVGAPIFQEVQGKEERVRLRWLYEGQDRALIPTRGLRILSNTRWFRDAPTATTDFGSSEARGSVFWPIAKTHRIAFVAAGGTSFNRPIPTLYDFTLGGPLQLTAYDNDEFRGDKFLLGSVAYLKQISRLPDFVGAAVYVTGLAEFGSAFDDFDDADMRSSYSGGLLMETGVGLVAAVIAVGDDGSARLVFSLGRSFR